MCAYIYIHIHIYIYIYMYIAYPLLFALKPCSSHASSLNSRLIVPKVSPIHAVRIQVILP